MPPASQTEHHVVSNTALPYISNSSVTSTNPQYIQGSSNIYTSLREWSENRPGFATTIVPGSWQNLRRQFVWRRWAGSTPNGGAFIWMGCDIRGGVATVWKYQFGTDVTATLLWTSTSSEPFDFVVSNNTCFFGNGTDMKKYDSSAFSNWGFPGPVAAPTLTFTAGALNAFTSWFYCATYFNSNTQQESSPSPISLGTSVITSKNVVLQLTASTDPQVTNIRVYRTPDGGAQDPSLMQEITGSPFANVTGPVTDSTLDVNLSIRTAPEFLRNDPPTPSKGFVVYAGRIWGFANNTTYYSGFEEISNGVPEECWPSGLNGNFYPWANEVTAHAPLIDGIAVLQPDRISKVEGDSLDTFRRYTLLEKRGTRSRTTVAALGGSVAWFDTSNTIWVSDIGEVGLPIRPDTATIDPLNAYLTIHISGVNHWLILLDGATATMWVYDLDTRQWMPPWDIGTTASAMFSGETSLGVVDLVVARNQTKALKLVSTAYNDDGTTYSSIGMTNLQRMTPDNNPSFQGTHDWSEVKTDAVPPNGIFQLTDDDPSFAPYTDITAYLEPSPLLQQGTFLQSWRYPAPPQSAAFMSMKYVWNAQGLTGGNWHLYGIDDAYHGAGG